MAASLWDYGEQEMSHRALQMTDADLRHIQAIAATYEDPAHALPVAGQHVTHNHVTALAAITYYEGEGRELTRTRRRPQKDRPDRFAPLPPDPISGL